MRAGSNPPSVFTIFRFAAYLNLVQDPRVLRRQYSITISGEIEVGIGDGTVKRFGAPTILLAEDLTGQGHTTRVVGTEIRISVAIPLAD